MYTVINVLFINDSIGKVSSIKIIHMLIKDTVFSTKAVCMGGNKIKLINIQIVIKVK